jgi:hypothetical protein
MSALMPFLSLDQPGAEVQAWVHRQLTAAGFRVVQTFDLQVARRAHQDCTCPHHGTADCDCQLVVLLVYQQDEEPSTLVIHSRDSSTEISLAGAGTGRVDPQPEQAIERLILSCLPRLPISA